jgi:hypothetical protein
MAGQRTAEDMYQDYLKAGGGGVLGTVEYFREVIDSTEAASDD